MIVRTKCHPEANGRKPLAGEREYRAGYTLENGEILTVCMGQQGFDTVSGLLMDMLTGVPSHSDGSMDRGDSQISP